MTRTPIWQAIATRLRDEIADGIHRPGDKLPTEAALATRFGVNRHTVRQALAALAAEALVRPRRGAGVFVTATPTDYPIGARVRFHQNLRAAGRSPAKQMLALETRAPSPAERDALGLTEGHVHVYEGLSLADGQVIALFRSVFPAARFPALLTHLQTDPSVTAALRSLRDQRLHPRQHAHHRETGQCDAGAASGDRRRRANPAHQQHQRRCRRHPRRGRADMVRRRQGHADVIGSRDVIRLTYSTYIDVKTFQIEQ